MLRQNSGMLINKDLKKQPYLDTVTHEHVLVFQTVETKRIPQHLLIQDDLNPKPGTELSRAAVSAGSCVAKKRL